MSTMLQFKVTVEDSQPAIWRRLVLDPRLLQLHTAIQTALESCNCHLHIFIASDGTRYGKPRSFDGLDHEMINESRILLGDLFTRRASPSATPTTSAMTGITTSNPTRASPQPAALAPAPPPKLGS